MRASLTSAVKSAAVFVITAAITTVTASAAEPGVTTQPPRLIGLIGAAAFGALIGWYVYYINRYRKSDVQLGDITTLVGVLGGGIATALFSPSGDLFGAYGVGLFVGFFGYFVSLIYLVDRSQNFDADWFLDGRRKRPTEPYYIPADVAPTIHPMDMEALPARIPDMPLRQVTALDRAALPQAPAANTPPRPFAVPSADLSQAIIDTCAAITIRNSADIEAQFAASGGFIAWYNQTLSSNSAFLHRGKIKTTDIVKNRFDVFWNQIPSVFGKPQVTMIEFCALMCIGIQENSGDLWANPEAVGSPGHPGLAYAFDKIPGKKLSYNHCNGNWDAYTLFTDNIYVAQHRGLAGAARVLQPPVDPAWGGETWPAGFPTVEDTSVNGFVMEADFYKFRGRGIIQTTGRGDYNPLITFILDDPIANANQSLAALAAAWKNAARRQQDVLNAIASISTNADWNVAFREALILAAGIRIDSDGKGQYLDLSHVAAILNAGIGTKGSLYFMARKINGGNYPDQVVPMMKAMIQAVANVKSSVADLRIPRDLTDDSDPAAPAAGEISKTADLVTAQTLANLGAQSAGLASEVAPPPLAAGQSRILSVDFTRAEDFLKACETSVPRVTYGLGKKVPFRGAVPGKDFTQVDCSGFVREAILVSTNPVVPFPDGSVVQHDWVQAQGFAKSTVTAAKSNDNLMRIAFLAPQDVSSGIGHVVLIVNGNTLESHSGVGPDSRPWTGQGWQAETSVYELAQDVQFAALAGAAALQSNLEPAATFTVRHGVRYRATITLSGFEQFASNDLIGERLTQVGFTNVVVTGSGATRFAEGLWNGPDTMAQVDQHLTNIVALPGNAPGGGPAQIPSAA